MIIFGHDVGSRNWGYSLLNLTDDTKEYLRCGYLNLKDGHIGARMLALETFFEEELVRSPEIDQIAYEMPYLRGANMANVLYCTGLLHKLSAKHNIPIRGYSATEVKLAVSGSGKSDKLELELASRKYLSIAPEIELGNDHATDAIAVGICHFLKS